MIRAVVAWGPVLACGAALAVRLLGVLAVLVLPRSVS